MHPVLMRGKLATTRNSPGGVSVFGADDTTVNSETALNVAINAHFALKVAYNLTTELPAAVNCAGSYRSQNHGNVRL